MGRPAARDARAEGGGVRLRRARAGLLGRPLRRRARARRRRLLPASGATCSSEHGLECSAISNHLVGQAVCDRIDERHKSILPPHVWGDGDPEGVRQRAAEEMKRHRARRRAALGRRRSSTASPALDLAPALLLPAGAASDDRRRLRATSPSAGTRSSTCSTRPACASRSRCTRPRSRSTSPPPSARSTRSAATARFGFNYDPSHFGYQGVDYVAFIARFARPHLPRAHEGRLVVRRADATRGVFGGHLPSATAGASGTSARSGRGTINFEEIIRALNRDRLRRARSPSSGRTSGWTANGRARGVRVHVPRGLPARRSRSTPRSRVSDAPP